MGRGESFPGGGKKKVVKQRSANSPDVSRLRIRKNPFNILRRKLVRTWEL